MNWDQVILKICVALSNLIQVATVANPNRWFCRVIETVALDIYAGRYLRCKDPDYARASA